MENRPDKKIEIIRRFAESPQKIWQAWTDPELVKLWFGSDPNGKVLSAHLDVRSGGKFEVTFTNSDKAEHTCFGAYKVIELYRKLSFSWTWKSIPEITELVTVLLQPDQTGTIMTFVHDDINPQTAHNYQIGWNSTFEKLEKVLKM
jgi:uncharacterized protein YndB with AHSA1/START domain